MAEADRQTALDSLLILASDPEPFFDALTQVARTMRGMSIALIALVDRDRRWFKARVGVRST